MDSPNLLTMKFQDRIVTFRMSDDGCIWFRESQLSTADQHRDEVVINLSAKDPALTGGREYEYGPSITLSWIDTPFEFDHLLSRQIQIPSSYDETRQDHVTNFYQSQHLDFDDVRISFLERESERYRIEVSGQVPDIQSDNVDATINVHIDTIIRLTDR